MSEGVFEIVTLADLQQEVDAYHKRMNDTFEHDEKLGYITINVHCASERWKHTHYPYDIDLSEIKTVRDLLGWVLHLSRKTWMDTQLLERFICMVAGIKGWDLEGWGRKNIDG